MAFNHRNAFPMAAICVFAVSASAHAQFSDVFEVGLRNESTAEFSQEDGTSEPAPGSPSLLDDHFYIAGNYPAPIGLVAADEPSINFERAVTSWGPLNIIHFNLGAGQALPSARLRFTTRFLWPKEDSTHNIDILLNGVVMKTLPSLDQSTDVSFIVPANNLALTAGENTLTLQRTGGTVDSWISIDHVKLEIDPLALRDQDADGMPEYWERDHFFDDNNSADAASDLDNDGLDALQEFLAETNPQNPDTDGDGILDGAESITSPILADQDNDSLSDGAEIHGSPATNPTMADSDSDGAADAWELASGFDPNSNTDTPPPFDSIIGVNFRSSYSRNPSPSPHAVSGFIPQTHWNHSRPIGSWSETSGDTTDIIIPNSGVLVNGNHQATPTTLQWSSDDAWFSGNNGANTSLVLDGYLRAANSTPVDISLANIPFTNYHLIVYVGDDYPDAQGRLRVNGLIGSDRFFKSRSGRPVETFTEVLRDTQLKMPEGNVVRFQNLTGSNCSVQLTNISGSPGIHAIQIVDADADTDGDLLPDWWEFRYGSNPAVNDATADDDNDNLNSAAEFARGTDPRLSDTDGDGLSDFVETGGGTFFSASYTGSDPLNPDSDSDGLGDGAEVHHFFPSNPNLADSDSDGVSDAQELRNTSLPTDSSSNIPPPASSGASSFTWDLSPVQIRWNHQTGIPGDEAWGQETLFEAVVVNDVVPQWSTITMGLRFYGNRLTYVVSSDNDGGFSGSGSPSNGFWYSDWNNNLGDLKSPLGFSGFGTGDLSDRLRFRLTAAPNGGGTWTVLFEIINLDTSATIVSQTIPNSTPHSSIPNGTAIWRSRYDEPAQSSIDTIPGVTVFLSDTSIDSFPGLEFLADADNDGLPDNYESVSNLDPAADTDNDGLTTLEEFYHGTIHTNADTDDDGFKDGLEVALGSSPTDENSKPGFFSNPTLTGDDINASGMNDAWEAIHAAHGIDPSGDADMDTHTNAEEAQAGTDPFDPNSFLGIKLNGLVNGEIPLEWQDVAGKMYSMFIASHPSGNWDPYPEPISSDAGIRRSTLSLSGPLRFLKLAVNDMDSDNDGVTDYSEQFLGTNPYLASSSQASRPIDTNADGEPDATLDGDRYNYLKRFAPAPTSGNSPTASQAARFLTQATFGPTLDEIHALTGSDFESWIDTQITLPATYHSRYIKEITADFNGSRIALTYSFNEMDDFLNGNNMMTTFARAAISGEDQLRQRVAFALSQILVISRRDANLENHPLAVADFYDIFVRNAFGNYHDIVREVGYHPAMGVYLSHAGNQPADPSINRYPDENFAREVMQLFTIGLYELNQDGTRKLDINDKPIPTYSNTEITEFARVFTGLWFGGRNWGSGGWLDEDFTTPMEPHDDYHDFEAKSLLGGFTIPQREPSVENARRDIDDALRHLVDHPNCAPFISRALIQFLVSDNPSPGYVVRVASVFADNGSGVRGDLLAVVKAILLDAEARSPIEANGNPSIGKLREPVIRTMHLARISGLTDEPNLLWWDWGTFRDAAIQEPTFSPSVFNFYRPDHQPPGILSDNRLFGQVFEITNSYSSIAFPNYLWAVMNDGFNQYRTYQFPFDYSRGAMIADELDQLLDHYELLLCGGNLSPASRQTILNAVEQIPESQRGTRARLAAYLCLMSPEGATQR